VFALSREIHVVDQLNFVVQVAERFEPDDRGVQEEFAKRLDFAFGENPRGKDFGVVRQARL
jgi:hypothetical protein